MAGKRANGEGSVYPWRGSYRAYAWVTLPDGRRRRKYVTAKTRDEVRKKWAKLKEEARRGPVLPSSPTVASYLDGWLRTVVEPGLTPRTAATYRMSVRLYIKPYLGTKRLDRLTVADVRAWIAELRVACQCCAQGKDSARSVPQCCAIDECCQQRLGEASVHQAWRTLRGALTSAVRDELIPRNVASLVRMPTPQRTDARIWTAAEARTFLDDAEAHDDPLYAGYALMLLLGLRRGEVLGLAWEDINLDRREARIRFQLQRVDGRLVRSQVKTVHSRAVLPLPDRCVAALKHRRAWEDRNRADAVGIYHESGLVLATRLGMPLDPRNFYRDFQDAIERAGVPRIPMHSLRRTCATLLVEHNVHPRVAMQILRHSQIAVTMDIYAQVSGEAARAALDALGETLG